MAGNMSTGIRTRLVTPTTAITRQTTTIKYGLRMAKRDMAESLNYLRRAHCRKLGPNFLPRLETGPRTDHDQISLLETGPHLDLGRRFESEFHLPDVNAVIRRDDRHLSRRRIAPRLDGRNRNSDYVVPGGDGKVPLRIHPGDESAIRVGHVALGVHRIAL